MTPYTFATIFLPAILGYYVMAVLVQLPRTRLYRTALLPVVFWITFRASMSLDFSWNKPGYAHLNQALTLGMFLIAMRSTTWMFVQRPYTRLPIFKSGNSPIDGRNGDAPTPTEHGVAIFSAMWNALDLTVNLRGIGWDGFPSKHTPTPNFQAESRLIFALLSLRRLTVFGLILDILCRCGTIFDLSLTPAERYTKSFIITLLSGPIAYLLVMLFTWPPLFDSPWLSTSLTSFWGRRWHQTFRECFVAVGGQPLKRYLGRAGFVIGAFALSGILHEIGIQGMGRGADTLPGVVFFVMHGVGVVMEHAWKQATGRRVGGITGWLWMSSWLVLWGHVIVDAWARRGLLGAKFFPGAYRPTTLFLNWISSDS
ncbi:membrane bound O-acyl transferase family-domain-containing protein [Boletus coccyginus]|nr:membrane bound O-acyl transferase family-domain-containing protein [Boletus coccyginus]